MSDRQLDLFAGDGFAPPATPAPSARETPNPAELDEAALAARLAEATGAQAVALAEEASRRRLLAAVPALETLCRRFKGYGLHHPIREQQAACRALAEIGGKPAAEAIARMLADAVVQGPGLLGAALAAARLRCRIAPAQLQDWLRHADPRIRAAACGCVRHGHGLEQPLIELLADLNPPVHRAAACSLGRLGRAEARSALLRLLHTAPAADIVAAIAPVADEECVVLLGRIARADPALRQPVLDALDDIEHPRADIVRRQITA